MRWKTNFVFMFCCINVGTMARNYQVSDNVKEEQSKGTVVANVPRMLSLRHEERVGRTFKMIKQNLVTKRPSNTRQDVNLINLNVTTGVLTLARKLDREILCGKAEECIIQLKVVMLPQKYFTLLDLNLKITDINDNAPVFPKRKISVPLIEGENQVDDIVSLDKYQAQDDDIGVNGEITYTLTENPYFDVAQYNDEAGTPHLGLRVLTELDHEMESLHTLTLFATDQADDPLSDRVTVEVTIADSNDHDPVFDQQEYPVYLRENTNISTVIETVHATDRDSSEFGRVRYYISPSSMETSGGIITVNPLTGQVRLNKKLSKEKHDRMKIIINAKDSDPDKPRTGKAWLTIHVEDVNDNAPVISVNFIAEHKNFTCYVKESDGVINFIASISASDQDEGANGKVKIQIRSFAHRKQAKELEEVLDDFILHPGGLLSTGESLDRETYQEYIVEIIACDEGSPPRCSTRNITIIILDVNDNTPVFESPSKTVSIREDSAVGTVVTSVSAFDADSAYPRSLWLRNGRVEESLNGVIRYYISGGDRSYFGINERTGYIKLKKTLDHETRDLWKLIVTARDGGYPKSRSANCTVVIKVGDVNDNTPKFLTPKTNDTMVYATVLYDQPIMLVKAMDRDQGMNSRISYKIVEEDGITDVDRQPRRGLFIINPVSGRLTLNFSKANLTNYLGMHSLSIRASDSASPPLSILTTLRVKVTDKPIPNPLLAGFDSKFIAIVAILATASIVLLILIAVTLARKRKRKQLRAYNCKTAKERGRRAWMNFPKGKSQGDHFQKYVNASSNNDVGKPPTASNFSDKRNAGQLSRREAGKNVNAPPVSLPVVRSMDMDSGRGDSGSENDEYSNIDYGVRGQSQNLYVTKPPSGSASQDDGNSSRTSELGPRCVESCREFGHSDTCWLPSPSNDSFCPTSLSSQQSLRYTSASPSISFHYNCTDYDDRRVADSLASLPGDRYSMAPTEYFQTLPANYLKSPDHYYHGYEAELETINEGVPFGMPFSEGPDTYDIDDVSDLTNLRLTTNPRVNPPSKPGLFYIGDQVSGNSHNPDWRWNKYRTISCLQRTQYANSYQDLIQGVPMVRYTPNMHSVAPSAGLVPQTRHSLSSVENQRPKLPTRSRATPIEMQTPGSDFPPLRYQALSPGSSDKNLTGSPRGPSKLSSRDEGGASRKDSEKLL